MQSLQSLLHFDENMLSSRVYELQMLFISGEFDCASGTDQQHCSRSILSQNKPKCFHCSSFDWDDKNFVRMQSSVCLMASRVKLQASAFNEVLLGATRSEFTFRWTEGPFSGSAFWTTNTDYKDGVCSAAAGLGLNCEKKSSNESVGSDCAIAQLDCAADLQLNVDANSGKNSSLRLFEELEAMNFESLRSGFHDVSVVQ